MSTDEKKSEDKKSGMTRNDLAGIAMILLFILVMTYMLLHFLA